MLRDLRAGKTEDSLVDHDSSFYERSHEAPEFDEIPREEPKVDTDFKSGAVRSADANHLRFDLIHPIAWLALARVHGEGAIKYGDCNWERGMPCTDILNHVLRHYCMYLAGDRSEPHLEHAAWGAMNMIVSATLWPDLNTPYLRGPGCTLSPAMVGRQEEGDAERRAKRAAGLFDKLGEWKLDELPEVVRILQQLNEVVDHQDGVASSSHS